MHQYRTHNCSQLRITNEGETVKIAGWIHRKRDHGSLLFIDLRDHYGITQVVVNKQNQNHLLESITLLGHESVITVTGKVIARSKDTINHQIPTGEIELEAASYSVESEAEQLPFRVNGEEDVSEDLRLQYRFLDLRREKLHSNIIMRSQVINTLRNLMLEQGFLEFQTPILTASSPEGARDFLVPSRMHPGKFYALPQAPQQFKQLLMVAGFDKYFQIAPCFRDEDARADRSPGEFYQLDIEMSFVNEEDVFSAIEPIMYQLFTQFSSKKVSSVPFRRITYKDAILRYGSDKPDLRNPIIMRDATEFFANSEFTTFAHNIALGKVVRAIPAPKAGLRSRTFFDKMIEFAKQQGAEGLAYLQLDNNNQFKGPIAKFLSDDKISVLQNLVSLTSNDAVFFVCDTEKAATVLANKIRTKLGEELNLIDYNRYEFCWVTEFPFYEWNEDKHCLEFSHNPFSMPKGGVEILDKASSLQDYLSITAYQYDIVCNGIELSSGAIRNHKTETLYKAFEIVGYTRNEVDNQFGSLLKSFKYGAPPHGGIAPGIDRIVMLLADMPNIREVISFPLNQQAEDLLMGAPSHVRPQQLKELHIKVDCDTKKSSGC